MAPESSRQPAGSHWLPSIPATVFVGILAFVVFGFQEPLLNSDGDLARHLRHGQYMLDHHALIRVDPFSFTKAGQPFIAFEYGSQVAYALVYRGGGLAAVTVFAGLLIALTYALIARFMLRRGAEPLLSGVVVAAAVITGMGHWLARPHLATLVAIPVLLEILLPIGERRVWPFPLLFAIWANLHGGFVYGLVLITIFLGAAILRRLARRASGGAHGSIRFHSLALLTAAVGTLATPHGIALYRHILATFAETYVLNHTGEFASPNFHDVATKLFMWVLMIALAAGMLSRRRLSLLTVLVMVAGIDFALVYQRNITLFGLTALPLLALDLNPEWRAWNAFRKLRAGFEAGSRNANTAGWTTAAVIVAATLALKHGRVGGRQLVGNEFSGRHLPVGAVAAARSAGLTGHLFSDFGYGGYVLFAWPEQKVFIDGGTDFYGSGLMRDYSTIRAMKPGWRELMRRWDFSLMLLRTTAPIAAELVHDGEWQYWYCDGQTIVLLRHDLAQRTPPTQTRLDPTSCSPRKGVDEAGS